MYKILALLICLLPVVALAQTDSTTVDIIVNILPVVEMPQMVTACLEEATNREQLETCLPDEAQEFRVDGNQLTIIISGV